MDEMIDFWKPYADLVAFTNYTPWESSYDNPVNEVSSPCTELWRRLFVWWDGKINPCDVDYKSHLCIGNIKSDTLSNLWKSSKYMSLREDHLAKNRLGCEPCSRCTFV